MSWIRGGNRGSPLPIDMKVIGASSLSGALTHLKKDSRRHWETLSEQVDFTGVISGLNCHWNAPVKAKSAYSHLLNSPNEKFIIWHDAFNNSLSPHKNNNYQAYTGTELVKYLLPFLDRITCILYCHRSGTPDIWEELSNSKLPVVGVVRDIISRPNEHNVELREELKALHQSPQIELKTLSIVLKHEGNAQAIRRKKRPCKLSCRRKRNFKRFNPQV